jgi:hypothetical protein
MMTYKKREFKSTPRIVKKRSDSRDSTEKLKGKAAPLQAWSGPEVSMKLKFPDFMTTAQDGGKVVNLTYRPHLPKDIQLVLISVRG